MAPLERNQGNVEVEAAVEAASEAEKAARRNAALAAEVEALRPVQKALLGNKDCKSAWIATFVESSPFCKR